MIAILLGTYNGERYLHEQLDSLFAQTYKDFHLYVRDDGSTDNTLSIIQEYQQIYSNITLICDKETNIGAKWNFERLLQHAQADYYMFCDQDDVWFPNKIKLTLDRMHQLENRHGDIPLLVHTDLQVVDCELHLIHHSFWEYSNINPKIVDENIYYMGISNSVTGCTTMINDKAKKSVLPFPRQIFMHDAWIALNVMKYGKIDYIENATIKYRQHTNNVLGAVKYNFSFFNKIKNIKTVYTNNRNQYLLAHPLVFKNIPHYLFFKLKYSYLIHCKKQLNTKN